VCKRRWALLGPRDRLVRLAPFGLASFGLSLFYFTFSTFLCKEKSASYSFARCIADAVILCYLWYPFLGIH
jgi:hypothetical protein